MVFFIWKEKKRVCLQSSSPIEIKFGNGFVEHFFLKLLLPTLISPEWRRKQTVIVFREYPYPLSRNHFFLDEWKGRCFCFFLGKEAPPTMTAYEEDISFSLFYFLIWCKPLFKPEHNFSNLTIWCRSLGTFFSLFMRNLMFTNQR